MSGARRPVVITGAGLVSPLADDWRGFGAALAAGRSALAPSSRGVDFGVPPLLTGEVVDFAPERVLGADANLRPLDRSARLLTVAAVRALADCGANEGRDPQRTGLAAGTLFGSLSTIAEFDRRQLTAGPRYVKPLDFANTVINAAAGQVAIWLGLAGVNATFGGGPTAALEAVAFAADQLRADRADLVLAGGVEELAPEALLTFSRGGFLAGGNGAPPRPVPFAAGRNGFALAEGAALVALEARERALARGARPLAEILGFGAAFGDEPEAVARAVEAALADADVAATAIDVWVAGANGSPTLDAREATGVARVLDLARVPVVAPKAACGEALGASGGLALASLLAILDSGTLPGVVGLEAVDPALPPLAVSTGSRTGTVGRGLVTALGLDGTVVAMVLGREETA